MPGCVSNFSVETENTFELTQDHDASVSTSQQKDVLDSTRRRSFSQSLVETKSVCELTEDNIELNSVLLSQSGGACILSQATHFDPIDEKYAKKLNVFFNNLNIPGFENPTFTSSEIEIAEQERKWMIDNPKKLEKVTIFQISNLDPNNSPRRNTLDRSSKRNMPVGAFEDFRNQE